jgi:hypothetical protein
MAHGRGAHFGWVVRTRIHFRLEVGGKRQSKRPQKDKAICIFEVGGLHNLKKLKPSEKASIEVVVTTMSKRPFGSHNWQGMVGSRSRRETPITTRRKPPSDAINYNHKSGSSESDLNTWATQSIDSRRYKSRKGRPFMQIRTYSESTNSLVVFFEPGSSLTTGTLRVHNINVTPYGTQHLHKFIA